MGGVYELRPRSLICRWSSLPLTEGSASRPDQLFGREKGKFDHLWVVKGSNFPFSSVDR